MSATASVTRLVAVSASFIWSARNASSLARSIVGAASVVDDLLARFQVLRAQREDVVGGLLGDRVDLLLLLGRGIGRPAEPLDAALDRAGEEHAVAEAAHVMRAESPGRDAHRRPPSQPWPRTGPATTAPITPPVSSSAEANRKRRRRRGFGAGCSGRRGQGRKGSVVLIGGSLGAGRLVRPATT